MQRIRQEQTISHNLRIIPKKENLSKGSKCVVIEEVDDDDAYNPQVLEAERLVEAKRIKEEEIINQAF